MKDTSGIKILSATSAKEQLDCPSNAVPLIKALFLAYLIKL